MTNKQPRALSKNVIIGLIVAAILVVASATAVLVLQNRDTEQPQDSSEQTGQVIENSVDVSYTAKAGETVLDQLRDVADIEVSSSSYGDIVSSINGTNSGDDGKYWLYYVNGEMANVGAAEYVTEGGELIEWKFE